MLLRVLSIVLLLGCVCAAPNNDEEDVKNVAPQPQDGAPDDLKTAASSSHVRRYTDYVTGYGLLDPSYAGYNSLGYTGYTSYPGYASYGSNKGYAGYAGYGGNGGYGGYGGNGGLNSYYGYNNPYYQGANHLGGGYYRPGYGGNIYGGVITPSLVTGYRGYSRR